MRKDWTALDTWLFLAALLHLLGVAGGLEAGALPFGAWAIHTVGSLCAARYIFRKGVAHCARLLDKHLPIPLFQLQKAPLRNHLRKGDHVA